MSYSQAIFLAIIQGLTEFLPISSSGHLVIFQKLFGLPHPPVLFDVLVHLGTLGAVVFYLRKRLARILNGLTRKNKESWNIVLVVAIGTIPAVVMGLFLQKYIGQIFDSLRLVGISLLVTAGLLFSTTRFIFKKWSKDTSRRRHSLWRRTAKVSQAHAHLQGSPSPGRCLPARLDAAASAANRARHISPSRCEHSINSLGWLDALFVGLFQALAILPGVSRSGSTIVAALWRRLDRETAFHFSFYLAIPAIIGAAVLQIPELAGGEFNYLNQAVLAMFAAGFIGYFALIALRRILLQRKLWLFGIYCLFLGLALLFLCPPPG